MTESEAIVTLTELGSTAGEFLAMHYSFTFAYLTVAYIIGRSLSTFQCVAISSLYIVTAGMAGATGVGYSDVWVRSYSREHTILDEVWLFENLIWVKGLIVIMVASMALSLYFMFNIRERALERSP